MQADAPVVFHGMDIWQNGFVPLHRFEHWRVMASSVTEQEHPTMLQKHRQTDEVFIVLRGKGWMLLGECPTRLEAYPMAEGKSYVVPMDMWHAHVLEAGSQLLIVENEDTGSDNSPVKPLTADQIASYEWLIATFKC